MWWSAIRFTVASLLIVERIVKQMKLNTGLNIPVQLARMSLKTVHNKKMLTINGKKHHVTDNFYLMIIKAPPSVAEVEKVNRSSSKRPKKLVGPHIASVS